MRVVGAMIIVVAGYFFGYSRRSGLVLAETVLDQLIELLKELRGAVEFSADGLAEHLTVCAAKESYRKLGFLKMALDAPQGRSLGENLNGAFGQWDTAARLTGDERTVIGGLLAELGNDSTRAELAKLDFALDRLDAALEQRREYNKKHKGYYEIIFTLAGIAVAIMLI